MYSRRLTTKRMQLVVVYIHRQLTLYNQRQSIAPTLSLDKIIKISILLY